MSAVTNRHPSTMAIVRYFDTDHLPAKLQTIAMPCRDLAYLTLGRLEDSPELTAGLRKLLEAKDCFVRAALDLPESGA